VRFSKKCASAVNSNKANNPHGLFEFFGLT